jgi:hypothetical protein
VKQLRAGEHGGGLIRSISVTCISFEEALKRAEVESAQGHPTLLLGNGFGIAYDANIFSYKALFKSVDWSNAERVQRVFEALKTWDFEFGYPDDARPPVGLGCGLYLGYKP